ncbi:unnamed protein product, partial [Symbiodinium sp. CCMP2456]
MFYYLNSTDQYWVFVSVSAFYDTVLAKPLLYSAALHTLARIYSIRTSGPVLEWILVFLAMVLVQLCGYFFEALVTGCMEYLLAEGDLAWQLESLSAADGRMVGSLFRSLMSSDVDTGTAWRADAMPGTSFLGLLGEEVGLRVAAAAGARSCQALAQVSHAAARSLGDEAAWRAFCVGLLQERQGSEEDPLLASFAGSWAGTALSLLGSSGGPMPPSRRPAKTCSLATLRDVAAKLQSGRISEMVARRAAAELTTADFRRLFEALPGTPVVVEVALLRAGFSLQLDGMVVWAKEEAGRTPRVLVVADMLRIHVALPLLCSFWGMSQIREGSMLLLLFTMYSATHPRVLAEASKCFLPCRSSIAQHGQLGDRILPSRIAPPAGCDRLLRNTSFHEFEEAFTEFLQSLDHDCNAAVMFFAGHGIETNSRLALLLNDPMQPLIYLDEILARLHERLDELLPSSSEDDPIRKASVVFFCDICREGSGASVIRDRRSVEKPTLPAASRGLLLSGDSSGSTDNHGHLAKALSDIICANVPHTLFSLYESANSRVQRSSRQLRRKKGNTDYMPPLAKQHAEIHNDSTLLDDQYDLFVDEAQGRQLRSWMLPLRRRDETDGDGLRVKLWKVTDVDSEDQCRQRILVERDNFIAAKHEEGHASLEDAAEKTRKRNESLRSRLTKYKQRAEAAKETAAQLEQERRRSQSLQTELKQTKQNVDRQLEEQRQKYEKLRAESPQCARKLKPEAVDKDFRAPNIFAEDFLLDAREPPEGFVGLDGWLLVGPERSGSRWHFDPWGTAAWNLLFEGEKLWAMAPPTGAPPQVEAQMLESSLSGETVRRYYSAPPALAGLLMSLPG